MAGKKIEQKDWEYTFFREFWSFYQNNYIPEDTDDYWNKLVKESDEICKKYGNTRFTRDIMLAVVNELERRSKSEFQNI